MRIVGFVALFTVLSLTAEQAHAQISDGVVKIGVLNESGPYAAIAGPGSRVAALMAVEDFGAAAKGMKVEIVFGDHRNKPDVGAKIAREWYDTEKVDVIVDVPTSSVTLAVNQIAREKRKVSSLTTELVPKRLEALKTLTPRLRRVWAISHGADPASGAASARAVEVSSRFGIEVVPRTVRTPDELERILDGLPAGDALLVSDIAMMDMSAVLLETSLARRVPAVFSSELWVSHGGLVSYGADYRAQGVQAARLVGKILHGVRPRDLPVEGADRIVLAVNLKTAASFGLTAPRTLLFRADILRR